VTSETGEYLGVFTDADRRMLREVHEMLTSLHLELAEYRPLMIRLRDNPVLRWRQGKEDKRGR
jgi:hypothetical protein